jgi:WD40 repeat protein
VAETVAAVASVATTPARAVDPSEGQRLARRLERLARPAERLEAATAWLARFGPEHPDRAAVEAIARAGRLVEPLRRMTMSRRDAWGVRFLDARRIIAAGPGGVRVWDAHTGEPLARSDIEGVALAVAGGAAYVANSSNVLRLDAALEVAASIDAGAAIEGMAITPDGRLLIVGMWDRTARAIALPEGRVVATLGEHAHGVTGVAISSDGRFAVTCTGAGAEHRGDYDNSARLWELGEGGARLVRREETGGHAMCAGFTPDGARYVVGTSGARLYVFEVARAGALLELHGADVRLSTDLQGVLAPAHSGGVREVVVAGDGVRLWTVSGGEAAFRNELRAWDLRDGAERYRVLGRAAPLRSLALSPDGRLLVTSDEDRGIEVWATE